MNAVPLRLKLALVAMGLTLLGVALGLTVVYWSLLSLRLSAFDRESRLLGGLILESAVLREDQTVRIPRVVESYLTDESGASAAQAYLDGELIWEGGAIDAPRPLDPAGLLTGETGQSVDDWRVYTVRDEGTDVVVQVGRPLLGVREVLRPFTTIALPLTVALALVSGALAWGIVGLALRPLRRLSEAAEGFEAGATVPELPGRDESARLARAVATLLARLRQEREREHRFLAYAAHALRTPISALRAGLESASAGRVSLEGASLGRLLREAIRLELLAQNLLALSRAEAGEANFEPIDLERLLGEAYDRFQPLALERGLALRLEAAPTPLLGEPRLLAQALDNLVANALRFTPQGGIVLRCGREGREAFLEVADTGPGVREPARDGLGLRVVRAVAQLHAGRVEFRREGGARVRLWLAVEPASAAALGRSGPAGDGAAGADGPPRP